MGTDSAERCVVGIQVPSSIVKAFDVRIKAEDVYVNYSDAGTRKAHGSFHASGELHFKIGRRYVEWTGGATGDFEPMKLFRTRPGNVDAREEFWTIGWEVSKIASVLPGLDSGPGFLVDAQGLAGDSILGLAVSVVGDKVRSRQSVVGYPVVASHRFGTGVRVEIEAFVVS